MFYSCEHLMVSIINLIIYWIINYEKQLNSLSVKYCYNYIKKTNN